jgi:hypothetical protein
MYLNFHHLTGHYRDTRVRQQHVAVAAALLHQPPGLGQFVFEIGSPQVVAGPACELALDDKAAA